MSDGCSSRVSIGGGEFLTCEHHYSLSESRKHQAKYWGLKWYWSDAEAEKEE